MCFDYIKIILKAIAGNWRCMFPPNHYVQNDDAYMNSIAQ